MAHDDLARRLELVRRVVERSPEPLHVPLGLLFLPEDGASHLRAWSEHADRAARGRAYAPATLYAHVPFCARVCTYCLLSAVRTPGGETVEAYLAAMRRQIAVYEPVVRGLRFGSLHLGGGTPTLLDERQLDGLLAELSRFSMSEGAQIGVEAHPGTSTPGRLAVLREHGVQRLSFGVETMTPAVLRNVNREDQNEARVRAAVAAARRLGFAVNLDLLAGLPGEDAATWESTVRKALELEPDSLSVNRFLGENSLLDRFGFGPGAEENSRVDAMLRCADALVREVSPPRWPEEPLRTPGFGTQYVWDRSASARRYFQDDMIGPVSTLAIGHGALGHVHGSEFSVTDGDLSTYLSRLQRGELPGMLACRLTQRFEMAFFVADEACRSGLSLRAFRDVFGREATDAFHRELGFLAGCGLLEVRGDVVRKVPDVRFHVLHLLAFLLHDVPTLEYQARAVEAARERRGAPPAAPAASVRSVAEVDDVLSRVGGGEDGPVRVDVGAGLDSGASSRLAAGAAARRGLRLEVVGDEDRSLRQYESLGAELPPSMLWTRLAIRAAQAGRGEQRVVEGA
jgi:oxygen-independent coproporphyrinogen-3 oxidase